MHVQEQGPNDSVKSSYEKGEKDELLGRRNEQGVLRKKQEASVEVKEIPTGNQLETNRRLHPHWIPSKTCQRPTETSFQGPTKDLSEIAKKPTLDTLENARSKPKDPRRFFRD